MAIAALGTGRESLPGMVATQAPVVARSPDLATRPTEGLQSRLPPGDLRSRSRRGLETRAEPSPARNRQVIPGPFLSALATESEFSNGAIASPTGVSSS